jgi:antitoxin (DNA-binding transcriptional repressor) of toxin-antitoxin stability system
MQIVRDITCKHLHDETGKIVRAVQRGQKFRVSVNGKHSALIVPTDDAVDPSWPEIMAKAWAAQDEPGKTRPNPILEERKRRNYAARLRR